MSSWGVINIVISKKQHIKIIYDSDNHSLNAETLIKCLIVTGTTPSAAQGKL